MMAETNTRPPAPTSDLPRIGEREGAVDMWLRAALAERYDSVLVEALSPEILAALG